jgi:hypothetical protein
MIRFLLPAVNATHCPSPKRAHLSLSIYLAAMVLLGAVSAHSQEAATSGNAGAENEIEPDEDHDWLTFYYQNPEPEKLTKQLQKWSDAKILSDEKARPALVGFLSQVFRQNRDKIKGWYSKARGFPPEDLQTLRLALIFSRTSEADDIIKAEEGDSYVARQPPKVLEMSMNQLPTFDMLWGYFYATGSELVIERMIFLFRFEEMELGEDIDIPEGYSSLYEQLPEHAHWALKSNAEQHPQILQLLERYLETPGALQPIERKGVRKILSELLPKKYPAKSEGEIEAAPEKDA